jgi:hypothetical protein
MPLDFTKLTEPLRQLKLGSWPPLASHLVCLILGTAGAHVVTRLPSSMNHVPDTFTVTVRGQTQAVGSHNQTPANDHHEPRESLVLLRGDAPPCLALRRKPEILRSDDVVTALFPLRDLVSLGKIAAGGTLSLRAGEFPPCEPRVVFPKAGAR